MSERTDADLVSEAANRRSLPMAEDWAAEVYLKGGSIMPNTALDEKVPTKGEIKAACKTFVEALGTAATNERVFTILSEVAGTYGLELQAEQRGIQGTFIHFVEEVV